MRKDLVTTVHGTSLVEVYYAKITTIWQELTEFCPLNKCVCQGLKVLVDHLEYEFVMTFLMGLNESSQIRAQILLMNILPFIDQVFSLVAQEEHQRTVGHISNSVEAISLLASSDSQRRGPPSGSYDRYRRKEGSRSVCTHCGAKGHLIDRCYKLHGYPPGYRQPGSHSTRSSAHYKGKAVVETTPKNQHTIFLASLTTD